LPLVVTPQVEALVYLLPKATPSPQSMKLPHWPLRVLIVRSNPPDLGGVVPPAGPIRDAIVALGNDVALHLPPGQQVNPVQVDVLSSEPGIAMPATWPAVAAQIAGHSYHILVYLGHGDL